MGVEGSDARIRATFPSKLCFILAKILINVSSFIYSKGLTIYMSLTLLYLRPNLACCQSRRRFFNLSVRGLGLRYSSKAAYKIRLKNLHQIKE
uniref:Uncharacterized protein n=1 Tax=Heterorhabditis bacteriophora TaxID=37862 RepID=A0A1I7WF36_HETBA